MAFLNEDFWKDKVKIFGLNLDESKKGAQKFLTEKDWLNIEHYHVAQDKCTAIKNYASDSLPHLVLIDKTGKIVYTGHPSSRNFEEDIDALVHDGSISKQSIHEGYGCDGCAVTPIKGKRYSCKECEDFDFCELCHTNGFHADTGHAVNLITEAQKVEVETKDEQKVFISHADSANVISKFKESSATMINNEMLMENASKLQRAFFVLVKDGTYDPTAHKINLTVGIHTIAMGDNLYAKKDILAATASIRELPNVTYETRCE